MTKFKMLLVDLVTNSTNSTKTESQPVYRHPGEFISVVLASSSPPSTVVAHLTVGRVIQPCPPLSVWGINGMGQSRHWPNNDLLLGCSVESKHQLAPQATDSTAHLPLTSMAMKHCHCLLPPFSSSTFRIPWMRQSRQEPKGDRSTDAGSTTTNSTSASTTAETTFE